MQMPWSRAKTKIDHRLAMHVRAEPFEMPTTAPMVSFTFDDIPESAATHGAGMLEAHDAIGTFYVSAGLIGTSTPDWTLANDQMILSLHRRGHEIGCHTYSHPRVNDLDAVAMGRELDRNRKYLKALDPTMRVENFAYPFGQGSYLRSGQLKSAFKSSRGILPGINRNVVDLHFLKAMPLIDGEITPSQIDRAFDEAVGSNGWLIFYTHDVSDRPSSYGCSPALLDHALNAAKRRNVAIHSIAEALRHAGA